MPLRDAGLILDCSVVPVTSQASSRACMASELNEAPEYYRSHDRPHPIVRLNHAGRSEVSTIAANFWKEAGGHCDCCGTTSKTIWGDLADSSGALAVYFVQWTVGAPAHLVNVDLVLGRWGEGTDPSSRILVSLLFRPSKDGGSFMVIDGQGRRADDRSIFGRALRREEVVGTPLAKQVFALVDALWVTEPHLEEVRALNDLA